MNNILCERGGRGRVHGAPLPARSPLHNISKSASFGSTDNLSWYLRLRSEVFIYLCFKRMLANKSIMQQTGTFFLQRNLKPLYYPSIIQNLHVKMTNVHSGRYVTKLYVQDTLLIKLNF